ncbi:hypothetical protein D3C78_1595630 [compost metagenome]
MRNRRHQTRHTARRAHRKVEITLGEPELSARTEIGCHCAERHLAMTEIIEWHDFAKAIKDALTAQESAPLPREIHKTQDIPVAERTYPRFQLWHFIARVGGSDQRTNGAACNKIDVSTDSL